jgi:hypothetical protein
MQWLTRLIDRLERRTEQVHPDPLDISYDVAVNSRPRFPYAAREDIRRGIARRNPTRFSRLERDMAWLRKECIRIGIDPEQARWLV